MGGMRSVSANAACCKLCVLALEISSALRPLQLLGLLKNMGINEYPCHQLHQNDFDIHFERTQYLRVVHPLLL